jgi:hypothetical protein
VSGSSLGLGVVLLRVLIQLGCRSLVMRLGGGGGGGKVSSLVCGMLEAGSSDG